MLMNKFCNEADPDCVVWLMGRAGSKQTYHNNTSDFDNFRLVPRMFSGAHTPNMTTNFKMGNKEFSWPVPIGIAPVGVQGRVTYPDKSGDLVTATGAAEIGFPFIVRYV